MTINRDVSWSLGFWPTLRTAAGESQTLTAVVIALALSFPLGAGLHAQETSTQPTVASASVGASVPRLIRFSGILKGSQGNLAGAAVNLTLSLYELPEGGSPLWTESQRVQLDEQGHYAVVLGANSASGVPLDLFTSGRSLWLGVQPQISGAGEQPRVLLVAVPYALKAADSDTLGGRPASDFVTVESLAPAAFATAATAGASTAAATTTGDSTARQLSAASPVGPNDSIGPSAPCASMTGDGSALARQVAIYSGACALTEDATFVDVGGNVGIGIASPASPLSVRGTFTVTSGLPYGEDFETTYNPSAASTATSVGQFIKTTAAGANSQSFVLGQELLAQNIGTGTVSTMQGMQGKAYNTSTGTITTAQGLYFQVRNLGTGTISNGYGIYLDTPTNATGGTFTNYYGLYLATPTGPTNNFTLYSAGGTNYFAGNVGIGTKTPGQALEISGNLKLDGTGHGITFPDGSTQTTAATGGGGGGTITGVTAGTGLTGGGTSGVVTLNVDTSKVPQLATANSFTANQSVTGTMGVVASGVGATAISAQATDLTATNTAINGLADGSGGNGVVGEADNGATSIGVWGISSGGVAGQFDGTVNVNGNLTKTSGSFKIDDPIDPSNKFLYHSFVESPDMKNIYDGVVTLDAAGSAVVRLPAWFGALNRDFRYQLTAVGAPGPNLYIAEEVANNQFKIAGGQPGMKVSWQVTGTRQDAWANAHRIPVEEAKPATERGYYLHPELFGASADKSIIRAEHPGRLSK